MSVKATYRVVGMNCGHCVKAVTQELLSLSGVESVDVELRPSSDSLVSVASAGPLSRNDIAAAIDEAGYGLAGVVV